MYHTLPCDDGQWDHAWSGHDIVDVEAVFDFNSDLEPDLHSLTFYDIDGLSLRMHNFSKRIVAQFDEWFATLDRSELQQLRSDAEECMLGDMVESEIDWHKERARG